MVGLEEEPETDTCNKHERYMGNCGVTQVLLGYLGGLISADRLYFETYNV